MRACESLPVSTIREFASLEGAKGSGSIGRGAQSRSATVKKDLPNGFNRLLTPFHRPATHINASSATQCHDAAQAMSHSLTHKFDWPADPALVLCSGGGPNHASRVALLQLGSKGRYETVIFVC
jgi:hypothetical protein